jgi:hypothetical protein
MKYSQDTQRETYPRELSTDSISFAVVVVAAGSHIQSAHKRCCGWLEENVAANQQPIVKWVEKTVSEL